MHQQPRAHHISVHAQQCHFCSFYPLYPAGKDVNIDMTKLKRLDINDDLDILVTPSVLNPFAKVRMDDDDDDDDYDDGGVL